jgi:exodeoxyribonuclease-1
VVRFCYAHAKDNSLNWVIDDNNKPIFKLDRLAPTNGIEHSDAHDAMADVRATIGIAKIIKDSQPRLFKYALSLRDKNEVKKQIEPFTPFLHTSGSYPAKFSCTRLTTVLAEHPDYSNCAIVFNLEQDPSLLVELDPDELKKLRFLKNLPKDVERLQTKELKFNQSPMFTYETRRINSPKLLKQMQIDLDKCMQHLDYIKDHQSLIKENIQTIYKTDREPSIDVDQSIYDKFVSDKDREVCNKIQKLSPNQMSSFKPNFEDRKLSKLFLNFKARNYPETLTEDEQEDWFEIVQSRVQSGENGYLSFEHFEKSLNKLKEADPNRAHLWQELEEYANRLL